MLILYFPKIFTIKADFWLKKMNTGNKMIDEIRDVILTVGCKPLVWVRPISFNQRGQI